MFVHMSIHFPKKEYEQEMIDSMHRFGEAMKSQKGLQRVHTLKDEKTGQLIGLAIWDSKEQWTAAHPAMYEAVKGDDFELWEQKPPAVYHLSEK